jgi:hypothetical protein
MSAPISLITPTTLDVTFQGDVASGITDTGNPVKIGGLASSSVPSAVLNGQRVNAYFDLNGYLHVKSDSTQGDVASGTTDSGNPLKVGGLASNVVPAAVLNGQRVNAYFDLNGYQHVIVDNILSNAANTVVGNIASGSADSGNPVKTGAIFNSSPVTVTNGQRVDSQADANGYLKTREQYAPGAEDNTNNVFATQVLPLAVATYSYTPFINLGANATLNVKASAGNVYSIYCHNLNASNRFIQLHNTATTPGGGAVPAKTYLVPGNGTIILDAQYLGPGGINFTTGIAFAFSTTEATYTAGAAGDQVTEVHFK